MTARPRCANGTYDPPGDTLPAKCRLYKFRPGAGPLEVCPKCILYKAKAEVRQGKAVKSIKA